MSEQREILFRGKRVDDGEWVYGYYVLNAYLPGTIEEEIYPTIHPTIDKFKSPISSVDPLTVGQYTGINDRNGKRIFEGDIVKYGKTVAVVIFGFGCFCFKTEKPDYLNRSRPAIDVVFNEYPNEVEVIGNVYDNPELLEESQ